MSTTTLTNDTALPADWRDLLALTKPRVMSLVVFTGAAGLLVAPAPIHPVLGFTAILCIALGAGASFASVSRISGVSASQVESCRPSGPGSIILLKMAV